MKLSLRKAHAMQEQLLTVINEMSAQMAITVGKFSDPLATVAKATAVLNEYFSKKHDLLVAYYDLRSLSADAAARVGIPAILAEMALLEKLIGLFKPLLTVGTLPPEDEIKAEHAALKTEPERGYGRRDSMNVNVVPITLVNSAKAAILDWKRRKQDASDRLLHLNMVTQIEITDETARLLKEAGVL